MMSSLALEDFEFRPSQPDPVLPEQISKMQAEAEKMSAYEQGYQAGWDDAAQAQKRDQARISAEFARNLQELSFTFFEARSHVIHSMEPLLTQMLDIIFPTFMDEAVARHLLEELRAVVSQSADNPIELLVAPASRAAIETLLGGADVPAIVLRDEPTLAPGQAFLRMGHSERQIDLSSAIERMNDAIRSLFALNQRTLKHAG